jgi:hypothetical protein
MGLAILVLINRVFGMDASEVFLAIFLMGAVIDFAIKVANEK